VRKPAVKTFLLIVAVLLSGCVAYPAYYPVANPATYPAAYPAQTVAPGGSQAQAAADAQCARTGQVAVKAEPTSCDGQNCTTRFICK